MISPTPTGGGSFVMNLFGLRPTISLCNPIARCMLICAIYFAFSSVSFIGLRLGASYLVSPAADMRSAVRPKVDFRPRFDKFYTTNIAQRILYAGADCLLPVALGTVLQRNR